MAERNRVIWQWGDNRGHSLRNRSMNPQNIPADMTASSQDIILQPGTLGRRRLSTTDISLTGGPSAHIHYLQVYRPIDAVPRLFAFSNDTTMVVHSWAPSTWTAHALADAPELPQAPCALTFNNKFWIAYNSGVNRLHVYDGTSIRRVGLGTNASVPLPTNTGAGAYANTPRYYRLQFLIKSGSDVQAMTEVSAAVSFTPSGAGTGVSIAYTVAPEAGATHWRVYGLIGTLGDTYDLYEQVGADTAVGTPIIDTTNPANYTGTQPPAQGTNIPWPSVKYLATDGNRLLGAGVWETTAAAGETTPKKSRVYFSRVLGASDLGDDESIPDTVDMRGWIDVGFDDGDEIFGLSQPVDGIVFVFKSHHIYALTPTGIDTLPYKAELVSAQVGLFPDDRAHRTITVVAGVVYFEHREALYSFKPTAGLEQLGWDLTGQDGFGPGLIGAVWDDQFEQLVCVYDLGALIHVFNPAGSRATPDGRRGGWVFWTSVLTAMHAVTSYEMAGRYTPRVIVISGMQGGVPKLQAFNSTGTTDAGGVPFQPFVMSHVHQVGLNVSVYSPFMDVQTQATAVIVPEVTYWLDYGRDVRGPVAAPSILIPPPQPFYGLDVPTRRGYGMGCCTVVRVHGLDGSDAFSVQAIVRWHADQVGSVNALTIPLHPQEPL